MKSRKIRTRRRSLGQISGGLALLEAINNGKIHLAKFILAATTNLYDCGVDSNYLIGIPPPNQPKTTLISVGSKTNTGGAAGGPGGTAAQLFGNRLLTPGGASSYTTATTGLPLIGRSQYSPTSRLFGSFSNEGQNRISSIVDTRDFQYKTPLMRAIFIKDDKIRKKAVELLLNFGAQVNAIDNYGRTALSYACQFHKNDVIKILLKHNVDPDLADHKGNTPLMYAVKVNNVAGVHILLRCFKKMGVLNFDHKNCEGVTALDIATRNNNKECKNLLETLSGRRPFKTSITAKVSTSTIPASSLTTSTEIQQTGGIVTRMPQSSLNQHQQRSSGKSTEPKISKTLFEPNEMGAKKREPNVIGIGRQSSSTSSSSSSSSDFNALRGEGGDQFIPLSELMLLKDAAASQGLDLEGYNTRSDIKAMLTMRHSLSLPALFDNNNNTYYGGNGFGGMMKTSPTTLSKQSFIICSTTAGGGQIGIADAYKRPKQEQIWSLKNELIPKLNRNDTKEFKQQLLTQQQQQTVKEKRSKGLFKNYVRKSIGKLKKLEIDKLSVSSPINNTAVINKKPGSENDSVQYISADHQNISAMEKNKESYSKDNFLTNATTKTGALSNDQIILAANNTGISSSKRILNKSNTIDYEDRKEDYNERLNEKGVPAVNTKKSTPPTLSSVNQMKTEPKLADYKRETNQSHKHNFQVESKRPTMSSSTSTEKLAVKEKTSNHGSMIKPEYKITNTTTDLGKTDKAPEDKKAKPIKPYMITKYFQI